MKISPPRPAFLAFLVCLGLFGLAARAAAAAPAAPQVVPLGNSTFSITRSATNGFTRDTDKLEAAVQDDATQYCAAQGKQFRLVSLTHEKPIFAMGYVKAKIVFKALSPGEPEFPVAPAVAGTVSERPSPTGDLYADLLKLDDLRKKGILTDEEFQSEKKKVLERSK